jgi:membrane-bound lytic murein transglycosylase F
LWVAGRDAGRKEDDDVFCWKRTRRVSALTVLACGLVLGAFYALLADEPLHPAALVERSPVDRDLSAIAADGVLRVAIPADDVAYATRGGRTDGLAYDLASRIARRLGVKLQVYTVAQPGTGLRDLARGKADLLALIDPGPTPVHDQAAWTTPLEQARVVVAGREAGGIRSLEDLRGREIVVRRDTRLEEAARGWAAAGYPIAIRTVPQRVSDEELAEAAAEGRHPLVVMDERRARLERALFEDLEVSGPLGDLLPVRWATRPNAPHLAQTVSRLFDAAREVGLLAELHRQYLENPRRLRHSRHFETWHGGGEISPWDGLLQQAAQQHGFDWRLLAALVATESGFDPASIGPGGSIGLMQLMPATARAFGAEDPLDPQQNVLAGARHLRWLWETLPGIAERDRLAFTLAAYNMGLGHLDDVRELAAARGLDPDRWEGNVAAVLPLKEDPRVASTLPHGFARGTLTLNYVDRVLDKYGQFSVAARQPAVRKLAAVRQDS